MKIKRSTNATLEVPVGDKEYTVVDAPELVTDAEPRYGDGVHRMITDATSEPVFQALSKLVEPLELDPAIHRNFADLGEDENAFADFASRFGLLHGGLEVRLEVPGRTINNKPLVSVGEPADVWREEVEAMQRAVRLWDWSQNEDWEALDQFFASNPYELPPAVQAALSGGNTQRPAMYLITTEINKRFQGEPVARFSENGSQPPMPSLVWGINSLRTGIWFMLAREIHDGRKYKSCAQCGKWFEVKTGVRRTSRIYCSNACRTKAHRERQDEARRLFEEGCSVEQIAARFETDPSIVKNWVAVKRKG